MKSLVSGWIPNPSTIATHNTSDTPEPEHVDKLQQAANVYAKITVLKGKEKIIEQLKWAYSSLEDLSLKGQKEFMKKHLTALKLDESDCCISKNDGDKKIPVIPPEKGMNPATLIMYLKEVCEAVENYQSDENIERLEEGFYGALNQFFDTEGTPGPEREETTKKIKYMTHYLIEYSTRDGENYVEGIIPGNLSLHVVPVDPIELRLTKEKVGISEPDEKFHHNKQVAEKLMKSKINQMNKSC